MNVIQEQDNREEEHLETKKQITEKMVTETENLIESLANKRKKGVIYEAECRVICYS